MADIRQLLINILIFCIIITSFAVFYGSFATNYEINNTTEYMATFSKYNPDNTSVSHNIARQAQENVSSLYGKSAAVNSSEVSIGDVVFGLANGVLSAITVPFTAIAIVVSIAGDVVALTPIPGWIVGIVGSIVTVIVVAEFLSFFTKKEV